MIMSKENLKLISVRIDPKTLAMIDEVVCKHYYWKRNYVINAILKTVMNDFNEREVYDMLRRNHFKNEPVSCHYEII